MIERLLVLVFLLWGPLVPTAESSPAMKQGTVILDDEIETGLLHWVKQIFHVAGMSSYKPKIFIVVDDDINAMASVGGQLVLYSGLILQCDDLSQLLGVVAHEVGHIAGGHVSRSDEAMERAAIPAAIAVLLGTVAGVATGSGDAVMAGLGGGAHLLNRTMLKYSRTQESSADQAALTYLDKLNWPASGLKKLLEKLHSKHNATVSKMDPYTLTHQLTGERLTILQQHIKKSHCHSCLPAADEAKFQRIKAKLAGFIQSPDRVRRFYQGQGTVHAAYALAIADFRSGQYGPALSKMEQLCKAHPKDPYFWELRGQIQFESGQVREAIPTLRQAVKLRTKSPYIKLLLAHALVESPSGGLNKEAIDLLVPISRQHPDNGLVWRLLASAYGKTVQMGLASLALAEEAFHKGNYPLAEGQAKRAERLLSGDSRALFRVRDLMHQIQNDRGKPRPDQ